MATHERVFSHKAASCSHAAIPTVVKQAFRCTQTPCRYRPGPLSRRHVIRFLACAASSGGRLLPIPAGEPYTPTGHASIDEEQVITKFIAETLLPTRHGKFRLRGYKHSVDGGQTFTEPTAIISGSVEGQENVAVRVHDACFTSEVLGSLKCDCAEQLELALSLIQRQPPGIVIYLQQEGRGIGLANKIAAYSLQEQGLDTVDANRALGLPDDCREYTSVRNMLAELGVRSVRLITNNPRKINVLTKLGIKVTGRIPCLVAAGAYNQSYLEAKRDRMSHLLPDGEGQAQGQGPRVEALSSGEELNGEFCFWDHDGEPTQATSSAHARGGMDPPPGLRLGSNGHAVRVGAAAADASSNGNGNGNGHGA